MIMATKHASQQWTAPTDDKLQEKLKQIIYVVNSQKENKKPLFL